MFLLSFPLSVLNRCTKDLSHKYVGILSWVINSLKKTVIWQRPCWDSCFRLYYFQNISFCTFSATVCTFCCSWLIHPSNTMPKSFLLTLPIWLIESCWFCLKRKEIKFELSAMDAFSLNVTATISSHSQQDNTSELTENFGSRLEKNHELIFLSQPFRFFFHLL